MQAKMIIPLKKHDVILRLSVTFLFINLFINQNPLGIPTGAGKRAFNGKVSNRSLTLKSRQTVASFIIMNSGL